MYQITKTESGIKFITHEIPNSQTVHIEVEVEAGSKYCPDGQEGISHFTEHMVMNGSTQYPSGLAVRRAIDNLGGYINASTGTEIANYRLRVASEDFITGTDVLFSFLSAPLLSQKEQGGEQRIILEEIAKANDSLPSRIGNATFSLIFGKHPLAYPVLGYQETIRKIRNEDVKMFFQHFYSPSRIVVATSGKVSHNQLVDAVGKYFGKNPPPTSPSYAEFTPRKDGPKVQILDEKTQQTHLFLAFLGKVQSPKEMAVWKILTRVLSGTNRLFERLREKENLTYDISVKSFTTKDVMGIFITGGFPLQKTERSLAVICEELTKVCTSLVGEEELARTQKILEVGQLFRLEDPEEWIDLALYTNWLFGDPLDPQTYIKELKEVKAEQIRELARKIFRPQNVYLVATPSKLNAEELQKILKNGFCLQDTRGTN